MAESHLGRCAFCRRGASCSAEPATLSQRSSGCGWTSRCFQCAVCCVLLTMRCRLWHVGCHVEVSLCTQVCCAWWYPLLQQSLCLPIFLLQSQLLLACIRALTEVYRASYLWGVLTGNTVYTEGSQPVISECLSHMLGLAALLCSAHRLLLDCLCLTGLEKGSQEDPKSFGRGLANISLSSINSRQMVVTHLYSYL